MTLDVPAAAPYYFSLIANKASSVFVTVNYSRSEFMIELVSFFMRGAFSELTRFLKCRTESFSSANRYSMV